jgi:hypothetical protein
MGGPTGSIRYHQHSSQDHVTIQAPPLRQSRDTYGGMHNLYTLKTLKSHIKTLNICPYMFRSLMKPHLQRKSTDPSLVTWRSAVYESPEDGFMRYQNM